MKPAGGVILSAALDYVARGWAPIPIPHREKGPRIDAWQDIRINVETAPAYFNEAKQNIGVILGKASGGLTDLDLDSQEAIAAAPYILPRTAVFVRASKTASHWVYRTNLWETQDRAAIKFIGSDKTGLLELRMGAGGSAAQTIFPPSTHVSGEPIEWAADGGPGKIAVVDGAELIQCARRLAAASELARHCPKVGGRHDAAFVLGGFLARCGFSPSWAATFAGAVGAASLQPGEKRRDMARTARDGANAEKRAGFPALAETFGEGPAKKAADWLGYTEEREQPSNTGSTKREDDGFIRGRHNQILKYRHENIKLAIERLQVRIRFNEFSGHSEISGLPGFDSDLTDAAAIRLRFKVTETFGFQPSAQLFQDTLTDIAHGNRHHPVRDYLAGLRWDGKSRIDTWLIAYGGAEDTKFNRAVGSLILIAAVRRVRQPGCKFDTLIVFEGFEGKNKSQALRLLATRDEWFTDCLELGAAPREAIEQTAGAWIVEIGELHGLSTREEGRIKAFLSRQDDRARAAYGRLPQKVRRQFVPVGTTNEHEWLKAEGRRYLPVKIKKFDLAALSRDVGQLWAEAAEREAAGESIILPEHLWSAAADVRAERVRENPFRDRLAELCGGAKWVTARAVWEKLGISLPERDRVARRVGEAMRSLGFERRVSRGEDAIRGLKRDDPYYERTEE